ncbi:MAG TPA: outer membrane lipoprotein chaperone LolA [Gammaproteobacteria bacterium]|nr:outer membrane lipoprotein chaperone LolA [Gammaproteobacteria bacterium]
MKVLFLLVASLVSLTALGAATTPAQRLDAILARTKTLSADFTETVTNANAAMVKQSSGSVAVARPGKFRWDYRKPYRQIIVADGENLWIYDPALEQVTVRPESRALTAGPAALLAGSGDIATSFVVSDLGDSGGFDWLKLVPRSGDANYRAIRIALAANGEIRALELDSKLGETSRINFSHVRSNISMDASRFRFTPPAGADVVHEAPNSASSAGP